MSVTAWKDNKTVIMASTFAGEKLFGKARLRLRREPYLGLLQKIELNHLGRTLPIHPWYFGRNPEGSFKLMRRKYQTAFSRFVQYEDIPIECGEELLQNVTLHQPAITFTGLNEEKLHTLIMFDPDAPNPENPYLANYRLWVLEDIPGNNFYQGYTVSSYQGPDPPTQSEHQHYISNCITPRHIYLHNSCHIRTPNEIIPTEIREEKK
ncbi:OV-16 antigen [Trichonephila clavipes]|nr:OV-16 antigen [Trichonephila clavipes]